MAYEVDGIEQIEADELAAILAEKKQEGSQRRYEDVEIIDVREPEEYVHGHIPGVPLVPMRTIPEAMKAWARDKEYIFICRSGHRSQIVAQFLKQNGFPRVKNFAGGMLAWQGELEFD
ncbi:hypothetical protein BSNK01_09090 [Bacillaceae bacterium]